MDEFYELIDDAYWKQPGLSGEINVFFFGDEDPPQSFTRVFHTHNIENDSVESYCLQFNLVWSDGRNYTYVYDEYRPEEYDPESENVEETT